MSWGTTQDTGRTSFYGLAHQIYILQCGEDFLQTHIWSLFYLYYLCSLLQLPPSTPTTGDDELPCC